MWPSCQSTKFCLIAFNKEGKSVQTSQNILAKLEKREKTREKVRKSEKRREKERIREEKREKAREKRKKEGKSEKR